MAAKIKITDKCCKRTMAVRTVVKKESGTVTNIECEHCGKRKKIVK